MNILIKKFVSSPFCTPKLTYTSGDTEFTADYTDEWGPEFGKPVWQRVMRTKPSPNYDAGDRTGRLPEVIPLDFSSFMKAFNNTAAGAAASAARPKPEPTASAAAKPQQ